ncbi:MAG: rRNA maturation RNase YbeY [Sphingobacteriia bacterium]|nr:rRNA maturation RNase YbeY [Sphingobacteriia bacterium]
MAIGFFVEGIKYNVKDKLVRKSWLKEVVLAAGKRIGDINYIIVSDEYLLSMNQQYLKHDTYTDIITFDYCEDNVVSGDMFISIDRVRENAQMFNVGEDQEFNRVLVHGLLHLLGQKDKSKGDSEEMRRKEELWLSKMQKNN